VEVLVKKLRLYYQKHGAFLIIILCN